MGNTWRLCSSLIVAEVPDTSEWPITSTIGTSFMNAAWEACSSLVTARVPDTSKWRPTGISHFFICDTWRLCSSLVTSVVPDTSEWLIGGEIGENFMSRTWQEDTGLTSLAMVDTLKWAPTSIDPNYGSFLHSTWSDCDKLDDISGFVLGNGFKSIPNLNTGYQHWYQTFLRTTTHVFTAQPRFADGTLITALGNPPAGSYRDTFWGRQGMEGFSGLVLEWTEKPTS
jgi:hypothetical protein